MNKTIEYIESAIKNIIANKLRTLLTMLGIIIGIASVIAIVTIGNGMKGYVTEQIGSAGSNIAYIYINSSLTTSLFTKEDADAIVENYPDIIGTSFEFSDTGSATGKKGTYDAYVMGVSPAYSHSSQNGIKYGRYFNEDELESRSKVCVIMAYDAKKLLGTENAVGMTLDLNVNGHISEFEIVGVKNNYSEAIMKLMEMVQDSYVLDVEIPYTTMSDSFAMDVSRATSMSLYMKPNVSSSIVGTITRYLENSKGLRGQNAINYYTFVDSSGEVDSMMTTITSFIALVGGISLVVGGIGVMNIMLVSVTERTREIGIRKSIGARTSSILIQFLAESSIISLIGGVIGIILGIVIAAVLCKVLDFSFIVDPASVIIATIFSTAIGLFFGIYPARKAARLKPIDALSSNR
ncbi:MAG: ABC transporter permease [Lachnospiraceae bacterium]|nr:ABC transporter permease [Lachnospiraceae bacterium]